MSPQSDQPPFGAPAAKLSESQQTDLVQLLTETRQKVLKRKDLVGLVKDAVAFKRLPEWATPAQCIATLKKHGLTEVALRHLLREDKPVIRYAWGEPSTYAIALSIRPGAYLSHASAVFLHGLTAEAPKTIYVNKEQTAKPVSGERLTQAALKRAFEVSQRSSTFVLGYEGHRIVLLNGKNTQRLEVGQVRDPQGDLVDATNLERTLIDIAVRPAYAAGVLEVLKAYRAAKDRLSMDTLLATLTGLEYVYPYHQAIGFYLQRAGVEAKDLEPLRKLGLDFDFYLAHEMGATKFSAEWRIHYPAGLQLAA